MNLPIVHIFLATYNRAHLIGETLDTILAQTHTQWMCIIIDDNSTDETEDFVLANYVAKDSRFVFLKKDLNKYKKGLAATRNMSLDLAKEMGVKYIQFFDDDDIMHPQKMALQMAPFIENDALHMTLCKYRTFDENLYYDFDLARCEDYSTTIFSSNLFWDFYAGKINLNSLGPIWKMDFIGKCKFDERLKTGEERDFYLRLFFNEKVNYHPVDFILFWYRKHEITVTKTKTISTIESIQSLKILRQKTRKMIFMSNNVNLRKRIVAFWMYLKDIV